LNKVLDMKSTLVQTLAVGVVAGLVASAIHWLSVGQTIQSQVDRLEMLYAAVEGTDASRPFTSSGHPSSMPGVIYDPNSKPTGLPPGYSTPDITPRRPPAPPAAQNATESKTETETVGESKTETELTPAQAQSPALGPAIEIERLPSSTVPSMVPGIIYEPKGGATVPSMVPGIIQQAEGQEGANRGPIEGDGVVRLESPRYTMVVDTATSRVPQGVPGIIYRPRAKRQFADGVWSGILQRQFEKLSWYVVYNLTRQALP